MSEIRSYRDLVVWQKSKDLALECYKLTKFFPVEEKFSLISQIRRAASSVPANIAEGFGRTTGKDREHFYIMARGSLYELDTHLQIALELAYLKTEDHSNFYEKFEEVSKILSVFIKTHQQKRL